MTQTPTYLAIDLKSFYASVECREKGLDPLTTNLVVADVSRTEKTICLAVSPSLKAFGIPGRARLFEVVQKMKEVNAERLRNAPGRRFSGKSWKADELAKDTSLEADYLAATPRMALYMEYSTRIYQVYLRHIAPEDIHVYSIDEVLIDATQYLKTYDTTGRELAKKLILEVFQETGITATAGVGTNLYLAKVAMDMLAKHENADEDGVRIAELDEMSYRRRLWSHRPLRDFWRVGGGIARKLESQGIFTMGDIARCSLGKPGEHWNEDLLYRMFGVNAELLIDHAWGKEPCTMPLIKAYRPEEKGFSSGQVLHCAYTADQARTVMHEMAEAAALNLVEKGLVTNQLTLTVGYDISNLTDPALRGTQDPPAGRGKPAPSAGSGPQDLSPGRGKYRGEITIDRYGRQMPKPAHGTANLDRYTSSGKLISDAVLELYDRIIDRSLLVRRMYLNVNHVLPEQEAASRAPDFEQLDLFTDYAEKEAQKKKEDAALSKEKDLQRAMLEIRKKFGSNAIVKGVNMHEESTGRDRNKFIGGHKA